MKPQLKIKSLFRLKKENEAIKDRIIRDIRNLFHHEENYYYKLVRVGNFWSSNYIKYEIFFPKHHNICIKS